MSDVLDGIGEDVEGEGASRRRSLWLLLVLFVAAALVAIFMVVLSGGSKQNAAPPPVQTVGPIVTSHSPTVGNNGVSVSPSSPSQSAQTSGGPATANSSAPVAGAGDVLGVVNQLRAAHHLTPVTGAESTNAQQCAQSHGSGATCVPHYIFAGSTSQDASAGIQRIQSFNPTWLLDPTTTRIEFGWSHTGTQYNLAILKWP